MDLRGLDLVDAVVVAANPPVVAALSFWPNFSTKISHGIFSGYTETIKVLAVAGSNDRLTAQCVAVTLGSGADLVVKGARSIKELKNYATV